MAAKIGSKGGPLQGGGIKKYDQNTLELIFQVGKEIN